MGHDATPQNQTNAEDFNVCPKVAFPHLVGNADGGTAYSISDIGSCVVNNFSEDTFEI